MQPPIRLDIIFIVEVWHRFSAHYSSFWRNKIRVISYTALWITPVQVCLSYYLPALNFVFFLSVCKHFLRCNLTSAALEHIVVSHSLHLPPFAADMPMTRNVTCSCSSCRRCWLCPIIELIQLFLYSCTLRRVLQLFINLSLTFSSNGSFLCLFILTF